LYVDIIGGIEHDLIGEEGEMARFLSVLFCSIAVSSIAVAAPAPPMSQPICCACVDQIVHEDAAENGQTVEALFCSSEFVELDRCKGLDGVFLCLKRITDPPMATDPAVDPECVELLSENGITCPATSGAAAPMLGVTSLGVLAVLLTGAGVLVLRRRGIVQS
jgi:hypothetical protein